MTVARCCGSEAATCRRSLSTRRTTTSSIALPSCSGGQRTAARRGRPCAGRRAATTTRRRGSIPTIPISCSRCPIRVAWCPPTAACRGATGTHSRPRRCTTSRPTTRSRIASVAASRMPGPRAWIAGRWMARSPSTTGIPSTSRSTALPHPIPQTLTRSSAACAPMCPSTTARPARRRSSARIWPLPPRRAPQPRWAGRSTGTCARCPSTGCHSTRRYCSTSRTRSGRPSTAATAGPGSARISRGRRGPCLRARAATRAPSRRHRKARSPRCHRPRCAPPFCGRARMMETFR